MTVAKREGPGSAARPLWRAKPAQAAVLLVLAVRRAPPRGEPPQADRPRRLRRSGRRLALQAHRDLDPRRSYRPATAHPLAGLPSGPASDVSEVDFLIDGRLGWVEHNGPYFYGDDGNWLVASFLGPGEHTFTARVITVDGRTATDTVKASVTAPPAPPPALVGITWQHEVTPADVLKSTSGQPPPPGNWRLRINRMGWQLRDPTPGGNWGLFDVLYQPGGLQMRPTIEYPPYPNSNNGGFCEDTDPLWAWAYSVGGGGKTPHAPPTRPRPMR